MSTQKRESRTPSTDSIQGVRSRRKDGTYPERAGGRVFTGPSKAARHVWGFAGGLTAPFLSALGLIWVWVATNFLHKDQPYRHRVQPDSAVELPGSPSPPRASGRLLRQRLARQRLDSIATRGFPASPGHPAIPLPSGFAPSLLTLPLAPADFLRAERHDGKRDLYLLYAA